MANILCFVPDAEITPRYILSTDSQAETFAQYLASKNIGTATPENYADPQTLKPRATYCIFRDGVNGTFKWFSVLETPDWPDKDPPLYTTDIGNFVWVNHGIK